MDSLMYFERVVGWKEGNCGVDFRIIEYIYRDLVQSTGCSSRAGNYIPIS